MSSSTTPATVSETMAVLLLPSIVAHEYIADTARVDRIAQDRDDAGEDRLGIVERDEVGEIERADEGDGIEQCE